MATTGWIIYVPNIVSNPRTKNIRPSKDLDLVYPDKVVDSTV